MLIAFIDKHNEGTAVGPENRRESSEIPPIIMVKLNYYTLGTKR